MKIRAGFARIPGVTSTYALATTLKKWVVRQFTGPHQVFVNTTPNSKGRILIIAPGEVSMPVEGWGAVELIAAQQASHFMSCGYSVTVLNSWRLYDWFRAWKGGHKFVVNHYDVFALLVNSFGLVAQIPVISTTHYAYAQQPEKWDLSFRRRLKWLLRADGFVALNAEIAGVISACNPNLNVKVIPNGVGVSDFSFGSHEKGFICLGKVEPRKRQYDLAFALGEHFDITFVGAVADNRVDTIPQGLRRKFVGPWTRDQVTTRLAEYKALILLSDAEADALVLYEAQAAGLQVFCGLKAIGAQDPGLPWIHVVDLDSSTLARELQTSLDESECTSKAIRSWANDNYHYSKSAEKWLDYGLEMSGGIE